MILIWSWGRAIWTISTKIVMSATGRDMLLLFALLTAECAFLYLFREWVDAWRERRTRQSGRH